MYCHTHVRINLYIWKHRISPPYKSCMSHDDISVFCLLKPTLTRRMHCSWWRYRSGNILRITGPPFLRGIHGSPVGSHRKESVTWSFHVLFLLVWKTDEQTVKSLVTLYVVTVMYHTYIPIPWGIPYWNPGMSQGAILGHSRQKQSFRDRWLPFRHIPSWVFVVCLP